MSKLSIKNVSKSFSDITVLKSVNFELEDGEILAFLGNSGCGKSTLLRIIAGFETANTGSIQMNNINILDTPSHKRNIGMFFQNYALFPHLNVEDNIAYGLNTKNSERVQELIKICKLQGEEHKLIHQISGGQQQRVALARALAPKPEILLLDEPFSNIDAVLKDQLREELRQMIKSSGVSAIFVSHDIDDAFAIADKAIILHDGIIQQFDSPEHLYRFPKNTFTAKFMGDAYILEGSIQSNIFTTSDGINFPLIESHMDQSHKTYAIRPEDFILNKDSNGEFKINKINFKRSFKSVLASNDKTISLKIQLGKNVDVNLHEPYSLSINQLKPLE